MPEDTIGRTFLTEKDFYKLSQFIDTELGIKMPLSKKVMLESRLQKRLKILGMTNFSDYCDFLFSDKGRSSEIFPFFNSVTTNKTDFFRESTHFDYLRQVLLPELVKKGVNNLRIWSAACSSGEEPYTIAIILEEFIRENPGLKYQIDASDISMKVLEEAKQAIYTEEDISVIPLELRKRYFLKGKNTRLGLYRIKPSLRSHVNIGVQNLMDSQYRFSGPYHIIFCRNVLIYFERPRQEEILRKICRYLESDGTLFLGHSESMAGMSLNLKSCTTAVYKRELESAV